MDTNLKKKWIAKLLDDKRYPQIHGAMAHYGAYDKPIGYCCLAVLRTCLKDNKDYGNGELEPSQRREAGLSNDQMMALISLNDQSRAPFHVIAGFVDANL